MSVQKQLEEAGVQYLRILWCDNANVIRAKAAHVGMLDEDSFAGVGISAAQQALPVMYDSVAQGSGLGPVGEVQLKPDWSTLKLLPYAPTQALVLGDMLWDGQPWEHCPRAFLRGQLERLKDLGLSANAAFENEFSLLRRTEHGFEPADNTVFAATSSMNQHQAFIHDLTKALEAQGLIPEFYYPESAPGQQELSIRYSDALGAADNQIVYRETARGVAPSHGYVASFLPKVLENAAGNGCHLNLSLWQGQTNALSDASHPTGLSKLGQHFIAGVLAHLPALTALTIPTRNSFRRIRPHFWAGAFRAWGYNNREAAVRVTRGKAGASRFELKTCDATSNPYLALGAMLAAGIDGVARELELAPEVATDPGLLSEAERKAGSIDLLPTSLGQAIEALEQDATLIEALGVARARTYIAVRRMEWEALKDMTLEEEVKLLAERY